jgi:hypothetical protein
MEGNEDLSDLERELLELCSMDAEGGETTTTLYVEMLESPPDRSTLEATLRRLVDRGLMRTWRGTFGGGQRDRWTRETSNVVYEDDWWAVTDAGRAAIGLPPRARADQRFWMNPSSGPYRVPAIIAPWCAWRAQHGKQPLPGWYTRLTGRTTGGDPSNWS